MTEPATPGEALSGRAMLELDLTGRALRALRVFLAAVEREAAREAASPAPTGTPIEPMSLNVVIALWDEFVDEILRAAVEDSPSLTAGAWADRNLAAIIGDVTRAGYLTSMRERLRGSPLPADAYTAARKVLTRGRADDWSHAKTVRSLARALEKDRPTDAGPAFDAMVRRIARTEATTIFNYSTLAYGADRGAEFKMWVSHHDDRTRPSHAAADGQKAPLAEPFVVGGYQLMVPGDPDAPLHETANCRCIMVSTD